MAWRRPGDKPLSEPMMASLLTHICVTQWVKFTPMLLVSHNSSSIMSVMASQITGVSIVCSTVCSSTDQRKHQSSASLAFVRGIHRWPVDSPHQGAVTPKRVLFDAIMMFHPPYTCRCQLCVPSSTHIFNLHNDDKQCHNEPMDFFNTIRPVNDCQFVHILLKDIFRIWNKISSL